MWREKFSRMLLIGHFQVQASATFLESEKVTKHRGKRVCRFIEQFEIAVSIFPVCHYVIDSVVVSADCWKVVWFIHGGNSERTSSRSVGRDERVAYTFALRGTRKFAASCRECKWLAPMEWWIQSVLAIFYRQIARAFTNLEHFRSMNTFKELSLILIFYYAQLK